MLVTSIMKWKNLNSLVFLIHQNKAIIKDFCIIDLFATGVFDTEPLLIT